MDYPDSHPPERQRTRAQDNVSCQVSVDCRKAHSGRLDMGQAGMTELWSQENYSVML